MHDEIHHPVHDQIQEKIGSTAGRIWNALNEKGELSLAQLKKHVQAEKAVFDWAIGWLAREDKLVFAAEKSSFRLRLRGTQARSASA